MVIYMRRAILLLSLVLLFINISGCGSNRIKQRSPVDEGVMENPSGLKWVDITAGMGPTVRTSDHVKVAYKAWLPDGTVVEQSGETPTDFVVGYDNVIQGLHEAVYGMRVGGVRRVFIPAELAYGEQGKAPSIPPNASLIAEVKVLEIILHPIATTPSGLKYWDRVEGTGLPPKPGDMVAVHYTGWLTDGTKFDSSLDRGQVFTFKLGAGEVIPGWEEGLSSMFVGGVRRLIIPPELAYGDQGYGDKIPPGATLIFEIKLISVLPAEEQEKE